MSYYDNVSALSPKIWYKFNETTGTPGNSGSLSNSLSLGGFGASPVLNQTGVIDKCIRSNYEKYYKFSAINSGDLFDDRTFSIEFWHKDNNSTSNSIQQGIFNWGDGTSKYLFLSYTKSSAKYTFQFKGGSGYPGYTMDSNAITDGVWHHVVVTFSPSEVKLYIDGSLNTTQTNPNIPNSFTLDTSSIRQITENAACYFDELAIYAQTLTSTEVFNNYDSAYNATSLPTALTASALLPMPAVSAVRNPNYTASAMTASAASGSHFGSTINFPKHVSNYLHSLSLSNRYDFESIDAKNLGTAGTVEWYQTGPQITAFGGRGIQLESALRITGSTADGSMVTYSSPLLNVLNGATWSVGFFVKGPDVGTDAPSLFGFSNDSGAYFNVGYQDKLTISYGNGGNHSFESQSDLLQNAWNFVVVERTSNDKYRIYLNGSLDKTHNISGTVPTNYNSFTFSSNEIGSLSNYLYLSELFLSTPSVITSTVVTNIYNASIVPVQASGYINNAKISFNNKYNNLVETFSPVADLRFDSAGEPYSDSGPNGGALVQRNTGTVTSNIFTKNTRGMKLNSSNSTYYTQFTSASGTFTDGTQSIAAYIKLDSGTPADFQYIASTGVFGGPVNGSGLSLVNQTDGKLYVYYLSFYVDPYPLEVYVDSGVNLNDGKYHYVVATISAGTVKIYVDGTLVKTQASTGIELSDAMTLTVGGDNYWFGTTDKAKGMTIDEVQVFSQALTQQNVTDLYQAMTIDAATASSLMVQPAVSAGTGRTISQPPMTASAFLPNVYPFVLPGTAFATIAHPNFAANSNVNYATTALTASATAENPVFTINENNGVLHMLASASFPEAKARIPGVWNANPFTVSAEMVHPGLTSTQGALIKPQSLNAKAMMPIPPAYFQLTDDLYYVRLYNQHATVTEERTFTGASDVAGANPLEPKKSFLKFFNDVSLDIPIGTTRYLTSTLPDYVFDRPGTTYYDINGNIYPAPTTKIQIQASGKTIATPTPLLSKGYYDPYQRPAVRINNIEFAYPENQYITEAPYTLEFTIKTTKANQIIAKGRWNSYYYNQWHTGSIGLYNGKLYGMSTFQNIGQGEIIPHPLNSAYLKKAGLQPGYMLSDVRIDDGQWHHIIVQYGFEGDSRAQFWIDGELDKQIIDGYNAPGYDGRMGIRPFILGSSSTETDFQSDFETSVWSYDPAGFVSFGDAKLNYIAYTKSVPIRVGPMLADMTIGQDTKSSGNRTRALMLYFWPEGANIQTSSYAPKIRGYNEGFGGPYDIPTLDGFSTNDYYRTPPEQWLEWDIFPVDVTGRYLSDVIKPEAFGGEENARLLAPSVMLSGEQYNVLQYERKINNRGYFRDENDNFRYINLVNDIDLSQFDVIMFKNFPDDSIEQDTFSKNAEVDRYLSLTTRTLYEAFIKSLREAVDTGISLLVTNPQLTVDLGIVDRLEPLPDQKQSPDDPFVQDYERSLLPIEAPAVGSDGDYQDSHYMNKIRLVTPIAGMTDYPVGIRTDKSYWVNDGIRDFTGTDKVWERVEYRPNGLQVNDEFAVMTQEGSRGEIPVLWSAPFENVKAGTIVTAWQRQIRQGQTLVDNKFTNYASSIVVKPGDILAGTQCGGKIFVDLMHPRLKDSPDYASIDLNQTYWINIAESVGAITATAATELRSSPETLENKYTSQSNPEYIKKAYWTHNDSSYLVIGGEQVTLNKALNLGQVALSGKRARNSSKGNNKVIDSALGMYTGGGQMWFSVQYSYVMDTFAFWTPTISSLGIIWLSERSSVPEQVTNHTAQTAVANIIHPNIVVDKVASINAQSMVALGIITNADGKTPTAAAIATLPMTANAILSGAARIYSATPMIATAKVPTNFQTVTYSVDEVIVYINHVDPILYLREDIIK